MSKLSQIRKVLNDIGDEYHREYVRKRAKHPTSKNIRNQFEDLKEAVDEKYHGKPVVQFHRTLESNAPSIDKRGLVINNKNYGANTVDVEDLPPMIWTAGNPKDIPVLNTKVGGDDIMNNPSVATYRIDLPGDVYNNMKRYKLDNSVSSRKAIPVGPGEKSGSFDYSRKTGKQAIDLFGEDIDPKYLSRTNKIPADKLKELKQFKDWFLDQDNWTRVEDYDLERKFPKGIESNLNNLRWQLIRGEGLNNRDAFNLMEQLPEYMPGRTHESGFDWEQYNRAIERGHSPRGAAYQSWIPGKDDKRPWRAGEKPDPDAFSEGPIARSSKAGGTYTSSVDYLRSNAAAEKDPVEKNYMSVLARDAVARNMGYDAQSNFNSRFLRLEDFISKHRPGDATRQEMADRYGIDYGSADKDPDWLFFLRKYVGKVLDTWNVENPDDQVSPKVKDMMLDIYMKNAAAVHARELQR